MNVNIMTVYIVAMITLGFTGLFFSISSCDQHANDNRTKFMVECVKHNTALECSTSALQLRAGQ